MSIGIYAKAFTAATVAALTAAITALADNRLDTLDDVLIASAFLANLAGVWAIPNLPAGVARYGKAGAAALLGGLASVAVALTSGPGITPAEWLNVVIAVLGGAGLTALVPNAATSDEFVQLRDPETGRFV